MMALGMALLLAAWLVLMLMVIGQIERSLLLSVGAYAASLVGLVIGLFGAGLYVRERSRRDDGDS
jgi:hypothetical protein